MSIEQETLFNDILKLRLRPQQLASFVQNDFEMLIEDGFATKGQIFMQKNEMLASFDLTIRDLQLLQHRCNLLMSKYC